MAAQSHRNSQFSISAWDEDSQRFVGWSEMQQAPYRSNEQSRLFRSLRHPFFWLIKASELHEAATALWASSESSATNRSACTTQRSANVVFMVGGMSIENLLKARNVCAQAWPVNDESYKTIARGGHQLDKLAIACGFRTNAKDRLVLQTLSHYVRWSGRYSLPRTIEEFQNAPSESPSSHAVLWDQYVALRQKVYGQCMSAMRRWAT
jgi:hypothetical protein